MARITIARGDTGRVLCDLCSVKGKGWTQDFTIPNLMTLTGVEYFDELQNSVIRHRFEVVMEFASRFSNATLNNKNALLLLARRSHVFRVSDLEGFATLCRVRQISEQGQIQEIGFYPRYRVTASFAREGFSR